MEKSFRRLASRKAREAFVRAELVNGVAHQIRILRQQRRWTQKQLAGRLKTTQGAVSRLEDPSYGKFSIQTLLQVGKIFDVALNVRYTSFSEFIVHRWDTSPHRFQCLSFMEESEHAAFYDDVPSSNYIGRLEPAGPPPTQQFVVSLSAPVAVGPRTIFLPATSQSRT